jgi:hypothetical protein
MKKQLVLLAALLPGIAAAEGVAVGAKLSTLGYGAELSTPLSDGFNARLGLNQFTYSRTGTTSDVDYDVKLKLQTVAAIADWHPFEGVFRMSLGYVYDNNRIEMTGKPSAGGTYDFNGTPYAVTDVKGKLSFNKGAPYIGLGWGNPVAKDSNWGFSFDIGAMYQGKPKLSLSANGCTAISGCAANLEAERAKAESDLGSYKWWPVIALGVSYKF